MMYSMLTLEKWFLQPLCLMKAPYTIILIVTQLFTNSITGTNKMFVFRIKLPMED